MKKPLSTRISIFLSVDAHSIFKYYNSHDPAPLYNRQLSHELQDYLENSVMSANSSSNISYKLICNKESDHKFIKPILMSIHRHFAIKRAMGERQFAQFKKRNYLLLSIGILLMIFLQAAVLSIPAINPVFSNVLNVFSLVIMWRPVERIIFYQNAYKKKIELMKKMEEAESIVITNEKEYTVDIKYNDAA